MLRPEPRVLSDDALIPDSNRVRPPERLTHELTADERYRFDRPGHGGDPPDVVLPAGTRVAVLREGPESCRVATGDGLAVEVRRGSLRELPGA